MLLLVRRLRTGFGSKSETWDYDKHAEASRTLRFALHHISLTKTYTGEIGTWTTPHFGMKKVENNVITIAPQLAPSAAWLVAWVGIDCRICIRLAHETRRILSQL